MPNRNESAMGSQVLLLAPDSRGARSVPFYAFAASVHGVRMVGLGLPLDLAGFEIAPSAVDDGKSPAMVTRPCIKEVGAGRVQGR